MPKSRRLKSKTIPPMVGRLSKSSSSSSRSIVNNRLKSKRTRRVSTYRPVSSLELAHAAYGAGFRGKDYADHMKRIVR